MLKRLLKQVLAILIGLAFVGSLFVFIPHTPNNDILSYEVLVPQSLVQSGSQFSTVGGGNSSSPAYSLVAGFQQVPVSNVIESTNASNLLNLAVTLLQQENISSTTSGGSISCIASKNFTTSLCNNADYSWVLFTSLNGGNLSEDKATLSSVNINNVQDQTAFFLIYQSTVVQSGPPQIP
jgi:hypothetical protein